MPLPDDDYLDPVLCTEEYTFEIVQKQPPIEESLPPTDASLPLIEASQLSAEEIHIELTTAVEKDEYDGWMQVQPPDHRILTKKINNKSYYKCTFPKCKYMIDKKDHCLRHSICIHEKNGNPVKGKRKFKCDDGKSALQFRKVKPFAKVISTSAPQKHKRKKVAQVISEKSPETKMLFVDGNISFDGKSNERLNLSFGEFQINRCRIIEK